VLWSQGEGRLLQVRRERLTAIENTSQVPGNRSDSSRDQEIGMQEIVFELLSDAPGHLLATADQQGLRISASSLEELQHEAREALMAHFGPSHVAYRIRLRRPVRLRASGDFARGCTAAASAVQRC